MKLKITFFLVCFAFVSRAQFTRTFFNTSAANNPYQLQALNDNGFNTLFFTYCNSSENSIKLKIGKTNVQGDLLDVTTVSLEENQQSTTKVQLSGATKNSDGSYTVAIIKSVTSTTSKLSFYKILNNVVVARATCPDNIKRGFARTQVINGKLTSYLISETRGLIRFAIPASLVGQGTSEIVNSSLTENGSNFNFKRIEFFTHNAIEYLCYEGKSVYKRLAENTFTSKELPVKPLFRSFDMAIINGELAVFRSNNIQKLNLDLALTSEVDVQVFDTESSSATTVEIATSENEILVYFATDWKGGVLKLNPDLQIADRINFEKSYYLSDVININDGYLLYGLSNAGIPMEILDNSSLASLGPPCFVAVQKQLFQKLDAIEFRQTMTKGKFQIEVAHGKNYFQSRETAAVTWDIGDEHRVPVIFSAGNNFIGLNHQEQLVDNMNLYRATNAIMVGPYSTSYGNLDLFTSKHNRGYYVTREMIEEHLNRVNWNTVNYVPPFAIREWPAHGNVALGQAANLADFVDVNHNGVYEPTLGDYPAIYGDQCLLTLQHTIEATTGLKLEWYNYVFTYTCEGSEAEQNSIFVKSKYVNYGTAIHHAYLSSVNDLDIGYYSNDYMGTNVELGMAYSYNGNRFDPDGSGIFGFGTREPSLGMQFLKGAKLPNDYLDNQVGVGEGKSINGFGFGDGIVDNEYSTLESTMAFSGSNSFPYSDPTTGSQFYNLAQSKWANGAPLTYGGTASGVPAKYIYPGTSDNFGYGTNGAIINGNWSEIQSNTHPGDRRFIASTGRFNLDQNESVDFLQAYVLAFDTVNRIPADSSKLFKYGRQLRNEYRLNQTACGKTFGTIETTLGITEKSSQDLLVFPNPFHSKITVSGLDEKGGVIQVYTVTGQLIASQAITQSEQEVTLENLDHGMYLIQVENGGQIWVKKVLCRH